MEKINANDWFYYKSIIPPLIDLFFFVYGDSAKGNLELEKELLTKFLLREKNQKELAEEKGISSTRVGQRIRKATQRIQQTEKLKETIMQLQSKALNSIHIQHQRDAIFDNFKLLATKIEQLGKYTAFNGFKNDDLLEEVDISVRTYNCLRSARCKTVSEVSLLPMSKISKFRNIGKRSVEEVRDMLLKYGYTPIE